MAYARSTEQHWWLQARGCLTSASEAVASASANLIQSLRGNFLSYESHRHLEHAMEKDHQLRDEAEDSAHPEGSGNPYPCRFLGLGRLLSGLAGSTYTGVRTCLQVCTTV